MFLRKKSIERIKPRARKYISPPQRIILPTPLKFPTNFKILRIFSVLLQIFLCSRTFIEATLSLSSTSLRERVEEMTPIDLNPGWIWHESNLAVYEEN